VLSLKLVLTCLVCFAKNYKFVGRNLNLLELLWFCILPGFCLEDDQLILTTEIEERFSDDEEKETERQTKGKQLTIR
jgi:hypothetical protein